MSKMSQLHAELSEQAYELGYESLGEADQAGCGVDWDKRRLIPPQEMAHNEWLKEKEQVLAELEGLRLAYKGAEGVTAPVEHAIKFIKEGEA